MKLRIAVIISIMLLIGLLPALAQESEPGMDEFRVSYLICDWGLLTVEEPMAASPIFISIDSPADYSAVQGTTFTVSGTGAGLFEGNVIVEVAAFGGDVLFEGTTVLQAPEIGAVGNWSIDVDLGALTEATQIFIRAYSTSPADGSTIAYDSLRLNANSQFGLRYVELTRPYFGQGVSTTPLLVEGMAGGAFENTIVIDVLDFATGNVLAEVPATVQTSDFAGSGPFSAELTIDAAPGTAINIYAYQPSVADGEEVNISDVEFAVVSPLAQTYDRILNIERDDPIYGAQDVCAIAEAEFNNEAINPLVINNVQALSTRSMMPLVNVSIEAAGSSVCPAPLRTRTVRDGNAFAIETYYDMTRPVACTADLAPITRRVSLGTLPNPDFTITVNGQSYP
ncbi:MAG: hypothetical protein KC519_14535 [Anaerolineae bacterium]|nr:hypothetical protein [Anaerolineae bacterium]